MGLREIGEGVLILVIALFIFSYLTDPTTRYKIDNFFSDVQTKVSSNVLSEIQSSVLPKPITIEEIVRQPQNYSEKEVTLTGNIIKQEMKIGKDKNQLNYFLFYIYDENGNKIALLPQSRTVAGWSIFDFLVGKVAEISGVVKQIDVCYCIDPDGYYSGYDGLWEDSGKYVCSANYSHCKNDGKRSVIIISSYKIVEKWTQLEKKCLEKINEHNEMKRKIVPSVMTVSLVDYRVFNNTADANSYIGMWYCGMLSDTNWKVQLRADLNTIENGRIFYIFVVKRDSSSIAYETTTCPIICSPKGELLESLLK